jgi:hypothetical protein
MMVGIVIIVRQRPGKCDAICRSGQIGFVFWSYTLAQRRRIGLIEQGDGIQHEKTPN